MTTQTISAQDLSLRRANSQAPSTEALYVKPKFEDHRQGDGSIGSSQFHNKTPSLVSGWLALAYSISKWQSQGGTGMLTANNVHIDRTGSHDHLEHNSCFLLRLGFPAGSLRL